MKNILPFLILACSALVLIGCKTTQVEPNETNNHIPLLPADSPFELEQDEFKNSAQGKIFAFEQADVHSIIGPYLEGLQQVHLLTEEQVCGIEALALYDRLLSLNPSSLFVKQVRLACLEDVLPETQLAVEIEEISDLAAALIKTGKGETISDAIRVRETAELHILLSLAGLAVYDIEAIFHNGLLYFKAHTFDTVTNKFSYRYASNYSFFSVFFSGFIGTNMTPANTSLFLNQGLIESQDPVLFPSQFRNLSYSGKHQKIIDRSSESMLGPISEILVAQAALMTEDDETLNRHLDNLLIYSDNGLLPATSFIAQFLFVRDAEASWSEITAKLAEIDSSSEPGFGIRLFLDGLSMRSDYEEHLKKFITLSDSTVLEDVDAFYQYLQSKSKTNIYNLGAILESTEAVLTEFEYPMKWFN